MHIFDLLLHLLPIDYKCMVSTLIERRVLRFGAAPFGLVWRSHDLELYEHEKEIFRPTLLHTYCMVTVISTALTYCHLSGNASFLPM